ncbi:MAG TPA: hypothetical protein VID27_11890, partial [Blastocatellia bacterium]
MDLFDRCLLHQVDRAASKADQAQVGANRSQADIDVLKLYIERLSMITEALWSMLREQYGYSDEELLRRITEIDLRDGVLDGRVAASEAVLCPQCKRRHLAKHRPMCLYCGSVIA